MPKGFGGELIAALGRPLAAPSANSSGRVSATTAAAVAADLGSRIPLIVDGGPTPVGLESTIVKAEGSSLRLLRPGGVAAEDIERVLGAAAAARRRGGRRGARHAGLALCAGRRGAARCARGGGPARRCSPSGRAAIEGADKAVAVLNLSPAAICAKRPPISSRWCRRSTAAARRRSPSMPIPDAGLGEAINDRLRRAAAPRDLPIDATIDFAAWISHVSKLDPALHRPLRGDRRRTATR